MLNLQAGPKDKNKMELTVVYKVSSYLAAHKIKQYFERVWKLPLHLHAVIDCSWYGCFDL